MTRPRKTVVLEDGAAVPYDKLCLCTGSRPFVPPMEGLDAVENKTSFMTLDDAKRLDALLGAGNDRRVLIVGAGLIGLKCAEGIQQRVSELTVIDRPAHPAQRTHRSAGRHHPEVPEGKGVRFLLGDSVARFERTPPISRAAGRLTLTSRVVAVGVRPNIELAADTGCAVERGILIDEHSATTVSDIYAAGDCTVSHDIAAETDRILAILPNAYMQGGTAGKAMAGGSACLTRPSR